MSTISARPIQATMAWPSLARPVSINVERVFPTGEPMELTSSTTLRDRYDPATTTSHPANWAARTSSTIRPRFNRNTISTASDASVMNGVSWWDETITADSEPRKTNTPSA